MGGDAAAPGLSAGGSPRVVYSANNSDRSACLRLTVPSLSYLGPSLHLASTAQLHHCPTWAPVYTWHQQHSSITVPPGPQSTPGINSTAPSLPHLGPSLHLASTAQLHHCPTWAPVYTWHQQHSSITAPPGPQSTPGINSTAPSLSHLGPSLHLASTAQLHHCPTWAPVYTWHHSSITVPPGSQSTPGMHSSITVPPPVYTWHQQHSSITVLPGPQSTPGINSTAPSLPHLGPSLHLASTAQLHHCPTWAPVYHQQ